MNLDSKNLLNSSESSLIQQSFQNFLPQQQQQQQTQIIDCYVEITKKNYLPFILAVTEHKFERINDCDEYGYNALHYAVSQSNLEMVKLLIEELKLDPQCLSKNLQTPMMLAVNVGSVELVHYLIQFTSQEQLNLQDSCGFNLLIYAAKSNQIPLFIYFLNKGIDINVKDNSGCCVAHWAAYQNNLEMLKIIGKLSINLKEKDKDQETPLNRATENCSFKTAKYLKQQLQPNTKNWYSQAPKLYSFLIYIFLSIFFYYQFLQYSKEKSSYFGTLFTIFFIYFQAIFFYFIIRGNYKGPIDQTLSIYGKSNDQILREAIKEGFPKIEPEILKNIDFSNINSLFWFQKEGNNYNYFHYIIYYIQQKLFKELENLDFSRYCSTCEQYMPPQTHHCQQTNRCIQHYSHYSHFFGRIINNQNHLLFYCLIGLQEIVMFIFIYCLMFSFRKVMTSYYFLSYFETAYLSYTNNSFSNCLSYCSISYLFVINSYYFVLETFGIFSNQTRNEIFNRHKYRYLYDPVVNTQNQIWNYYTNQLSNGWSLNLHNYLVLGDKK